MLSRHYKGKSETDRETLKYDYEKAYRFRKHLIKLLEDDIENVHRSMRDGEYDQSWACKQADAVGQVKQLKKCIALLK